MMFVYLCSNDFYSIVLGCHLMSNVSSVGLEARICCFLHVFGSESGAIKKGSGKRTQSILMMNAWSSCEHAIGREVFPTIYLSVSKTSYIAEAVNMLQLVCVCVLFGLALMSSVGLSYLSSLPD